MELNMLNRRNFLAVSAALGFSPSTLLQAQTHIDVDAVVATGLDDSGSMHGYGGAPYRALPTLVALREVLASPDLIRALTSGPHGRCYFSIYIWNSSAHSLCEMVLIDAANKGQKMQIVLAALDRQMQAIQQAGYPTARSTNTPEAMHFGLNLITTIKADHRILNLHTDDNDVRAGFTYDMQKEQHRAEINNVTINGLVDGDINFKEHYMHKYVKAGEGAFVYNAADFPNLKSAWRAKFRADIALIPSLNASHLA